MVFVLLSLLCSVLSITSGNEWHESIIPQAGWNVFGKDMVIRFEDTKAENTSYLDRLALRVDYGNVAISAAPNNKEDYLELEYYIKDQDEGINFINNDRLNIKLFFPVLDLIIS